MKTTKRTRMLPLSLALTMLLTACGTSAPENEATQAPAASKTEETQTTPAEETSNWPEYLNMESTYPVIKEGYEDSVEKLTVLIATETSSGDWDNLWVSKYLKDKYNIELDVEYVYSNALTERKNLLLNSGDLPDLMWNMAFTTTELSRYGAEEELFLKCDEYISEELTPNLCKYLDDDVTAAMTALDGHIYSLPQIADPTEDSLSYNRYFINVEDLTKAGIEVPETLDEFTEAMYKLKEADPNGVGSENYYPVGGGMESIGLSVFLLNALGYVNYESEEAKYGLAPAMRDGEVAIPISDMDIYKEYLTLMNQFYKDGIINPNYFTIENTEVKAQVLEGKSSVYAAVPYLTGMETWKEWEVLTPLTSEWQDKPEAVANVPITIGGFVISADTEYPELCMRLADIFYDEADCRAFWGGTGEGSEYDYEGYVLGEWMPEKNNFTIDVNKLPEGYNAYNYLLEYINGTMYKFGSYTRRDAIVNMAKANGGDLAYDVRTIYDVEGNSDHQWRESMFKAIKDKDNVEEVIGFPKNYYTSVETADEITNLNAVIKPYVKEQVAKFITGARDLSEVDAFKKELEGLGIGDLLKIYQDIYSSMY